MSAHFIMRRNIPVFVLLVLSLLSSQCQQKSTEAESKAIPQAEVEAPAPVKPPVLYTQLVVNREGTLVSPRPNGPMRGFIEFGSTVEVVADSGSWLGLWHEEELVFVERSSIGDPSAIYYALDELCPVSELWIATDSALYYEKGDRPCLPDLFEFGQLDSVAYAQAAQGLAPSLIMDSTLASWQGDTLEISAGDSIVRLVNTPPPVEDYMVHHRYLGSLAALNYHVVAVALWESSEYQLFDAGTGRQVEARLPDGQLLTRSFGYPMVTSDKQLLVCLTGNPFEGGSLLEVYSITQNRALELVLRCTFSEWIAGESFWLAPNVLAVKATMSEMPLSTQYFQLRLL